MRGLYVHIPFCIKKCKYCDFNSFSFCNKDKESYLSALFCEMEKYKGEKIDTVFIGGGTPTSLDSTELDSLLKQIRTTFFISKDAEFTVEANPKTLDRKKLLVMKENGVTRLSVGVQSFNDNELLALGRIHTGEDAKETILLAKECGFDNINIDIISAIPEQTKESFEKSLTEAISLAPSHISCYSLILEEGTPLFREYEREMLELPDEDTEREIYETACNLLEKAGYIQYEISNFAKQGYECRHNIKYWSCDEYIGIGLSAHSYKDGVRFSNTDDFSSYINGDFASGEREVLTKNDKMSEFVFMGLRKTEGIDINEFQKRFSENIWDVFQKPLLKFKKLGMIEEKEGKICIKKEYFGVSNSIMCEFIL